ncbi:MAG: polyhydroxyalkanoic acid system family protein [Betaproteobacteria bacterium]|nr:polyhydroxyalkanoic acid synthase [Betaproteobacteria bacterium]
MAQILIEKKHPLGLEQARHAAAQWVNQAREQFGLDCQVIRGEEGDEVRFARSGLTGTLWVDGQQFRMQAQLGFLMSAFKDRIESEIRKNLDALINSHPRGDATP